MAYNFPGGAITMADVVRYANEHGMYFSDRPMPVLSQARRARAAGAFVAPNNLVAVASITARSGVRQWVEQASTLGFIVVATAWGVCMPKTLGGVPTSTPFKLGLSIWWDGGVVAEGYPTYTNTPPAIGMQNDPLLNYRAGYHMQYAMSYAGLRQAVDNDMTGMFQAKFEVYTDGGPMEIDDLVSYSFVEIGLLDVVHETTGLT